MKRSRKIGQATKNQRQKAEGGAVPTAPQGTNRSGG